MVPIFHLKIGEYTKSLPHPHGDASAKNLEIEFKKPPQSRNLFTMVAFNESQVKSKHVKWTFWPISGQCSHFIPAENIRRPKVFRMYIMGSLGRNGLIDHECLWWC